MSAIWLVVHYTWNDPAVQGWLVMAFISGLLTLAIDDIYRA